MDAKKDLQDQVAIASRDNNISSVLLRNAIGRKLGLNIADMECLSLLFIKGISTPTELARYTGLTTGSATAMLDRLERAGLIRRKHNPDDRRGLLIEPTQTVGPLFADARKLQNELIASYSEAELKTIADFLTRYAKNVEDYTHQVENICACGPEAFIGQLSGKQTVPKQPAGEQLSA
jgi:DNA-binding MarR family transcriptional regulator